MSISLSMNVYIYWFLCVSWFVFMLMWVLICSYFVVVCVCIGVWMCVFGSGCWYLFVSMYVLFNLCVFLSDSVVLEKVYVFLSLLKTIIVTCGLFMILYLCVTIFGCSLISMLVLQYFLLFLYHISIQLKFLFQIIHTYFSVIVVVYTCLFIWLCLFLWVCLCVCLCIHLDVCINLPIYVDVREFVAVCVYFYVCVCLCVCI